MSEQTPARPGDTVMIHIKAVVTHLDDHDNVVMAQVDGERDSTYIPRAASVEVLERADDPSRHLVGTILARGAEVAVRVGNRWASIDEAPEGVGFFEHKHMTTALGWSVVGSVPGTPAAEAEKPADPSQVPGPRCNAIEGATGINCGLPRLHSLDVDHEGTHEPAGEKDSVGYRLFVRWPWNEWDRDASAVGFEVPLPDWEREILEQEAARKAPEEYPEVSGAGVPYPPADSAPTRDLCTVDECVAAPRCSSGATLWHKSTDQCRTPKREPRVFRADGPEPPRDVPVLEDEGPDWGDMKYLLRTGDLWCWSPSPELVYPHHSHPVLWERAARQAAGPLREVV